MTSLVEATTMPESVDGHRGSAAASEAAVAKTKANEREELRIAEKLGGDDTYIKAQTDTLWYHWVGSIWVKPFRFDNRSGEYVIALKTGPSAELGKHRHRGQVKAYTVKGSWGYYE